MAMKQVRRCVLCAAAFAAVAAVVVAQGGARAGDEGGAVLSVPRAPGAGAPPAGAGRPWEHASVSASGSQEAAPEWSEAGPGRFGGAPGAQTRGGRQSGHPGPHPGPHNDTSDESEAGPAHGSESRPFPPRNESDSDSVPVPRWDEGEHGAHHGPHGRNGNGRAPRGQSGRGRGQRGGAPADSE